MYPSLRVKGYYNLTKVLYLHGQVPVVQSDDWLDARSEEGVNELTVELDTSFVDSIGETRRQYSRPTY